jgi:hypothetical protein
MSVPEFECSCRSCAQNGDGAGVVLLEKLDLLYVTLNGLSSDHEESCAHNYKREIMASALRGAQDIIFDVARHLHALNVWQAKIWDADLEPKPAQEKAEQ